MISPRLDPWYLRGATTGLTTIETHLREGPLAPAMLELVKLRASQINGCSFCVDLHTRALQQIGEAEQRIHLVSAWRETTLFDDAERAALALTEAATRLSNHEDPVPDEIWNQAAEHYDKQTLGALVVAIAVINAWNRINVITRRIVNSDRTSTRALTETDLTSTPLTPDQP